MIDDSQILVLGRQQFENYKANDKITSITGHKSEESLRDYASTDTRDHKKMSMILSNLTEKSLSSLHSSVAPAPEGTSYHGDRPPLGPVPQYVFNNCTVYMGTNNNMRQENIQEIANPTRKRARFIDSSDDED